MGNCMSHPKARHPLEYEVCELNQTITRQDAELSKYKQKLETATEKLEAFEVVQPVLIERREELEDEVLELTRRMSDMNFRFDSLKDFFTEVGPEATEP